MNWQAKARKMSEGRWVKFDESNPSRIIKFLGEPETVTKTVQTGPRKGEQYEVLSFPVEVDGEEKILEPNRSLLLIMLEEDEEREIIGRTFKIKCLDPSTKRSWKMVELRDQLPAVSTKKENDTDKEKFLREVEKRKGRSAEKRENREGEDVAERDENGREGVEKS